MLQFYVVDDLTQSRLNISHFHCLSDAVQAYKALPAASRKALGVHQGADAIDLVQCLPLFPDDRDGEDVMVLKFLKEEFEMKRKIIPCLLALALTASLAPSVLAAQPPAACYPTSVTRSEDGTQIRKVYDLGPEEDPAGIPRSDFEQEGFHYTLTDLLKQESPEREERFHTETVTLDSKSKDMEPGGAVLRRVRYHAALRCAVPVQRGSLPEADHAPHHPVPGTVGEELRQRRCRNHIR